MSSASRSVALVTLGCARNEVDSEELAGRLGAGGWTISDGDDADVVVINTCGFIDSAKKDSIDTVLAAADSGKKVVAVGCLAERYGAELAASLPEADAVLGFDSYADIAARLDDVAAGRPVAPHRPRDRRTLLPLTPAHRPAAVAEVAVPGHAWLPSGAARTRLDDAPMAYLKLASGCDRRCSFCAIPSFRGAFVSRPPAEILAEAQWLADSGARELVLVSENSTSYGKDLGDLRALERLLPDLAAVDGVERIRVSYLQPAELRPSLLEALATTPGVAPYFDLSFQHASPAVLRRMKRFGSTEAFLDLLAQARALVPEAGARSNVIVGFPGESEDDVAELERFLTEARLDVVGVFGYSDEDGTDAAQFDGKLDAEEIAARVERVTTLADELIAQRAEDRIGTRVEVLIEHSGDEVIGRAVHQGPDVDGTTTVLGDASLRRGQIVAADVGATVGVDLIADARRPAMVKQPGAVSEDPIADPPSDVSAWNIANALTVFRLLLVPVFVLVLFHGGGHLDGWRVAAWGVFAVASITDRFDGDIARKRGLVTEFGKLADPIADKALIGAALVGLSALDDLAWWITVVILVREVGVTLLRFWVIRHGVIAASRGGKVKTLLQAVAIGLYVLPLTGWLHDIATVIMYAAIVVTLVSGVDYVGRAIRLRRVGRTERATV